MHMPVFIAKYNEVKEQHKQAAECEQAGGANSLLGTIKVPKNLRLLSGKLPKSNYGKEHKRGGASGSQSLDSARGHSPAGSPAGELQVIHEIPGEQYASEQNAPPVEISRKPTEKENNPVEGAGRKVSPQNEVYSARPQVKPPLAPPSKAPISEREPQEGEVDAKKANY